MKKNMILTILLLGVISIILSGCGKQAGSEFIGTWKYASSYNDAPYEYFYIIEKAKNGDTTYMVTYYRLGVDSFKKALSGKVELATEKKQFPVKYVDGILEKDSSVKYYLQDGKLIIDKDSYERVSDKSMTFEEMNNGRGYPTPK